LAVTSLAVFLAVTGDMGFHIVRVVVLNRPSNTVSAERTSFGCASTPMQAAVTNGTVYWSSSDGVCSWSVAAPNDSVLTHLWTTALAVTSTAIYYATPVEVEQMPLTGGASRLVDPIAASLLTTTPHFVVWSTPTGTIHYCLQTGGPVGVVGTNLGRARALAADDSYVYLATDTAVLRITLTNRATTVLVSHGADGLVVDASELYWFRTNAGEIGKVAITGGAPTILSATAGAPGSLVVDATSVFYAERHDEALRVISPK
jgi:hypothetical protein